MLSSNTNKLTWVGIAVGVIAALGITSMVFFPNVLSSAETTIKNTMSGFTNPTKDASSYSNLQFTYDDSSKTASVNAVKSTTSPNTDLSNDDITIPEKVKNNGNTYTITSIANAGFHGVSAKSITLPSTLTSIGGNAFSNSNVLSGTLDIPSNIKSIGDSAFANITSVSSLDIPDSTTSIGSNLISSSSIQKLSIGNGVTAIPDNAFANATNLQSVTISDSVKSIGNFAFSGDTTLSNVTMGQNVTTIGAFAFSSTNLTKISLPKTVTSTTPVSFSNKDSSIGITISVDKSFDSSPNNQIVSPNTEVVRP